MFSSSHIMKYIKRDFLLLNSFKKYYYNFSQSLCVKPMDPKIFSEFHFLYKYQHRKHMFPFFEKVILIHSVKYSSSSKSPDEIKQENVDIKANDAASAVDPQGKSSTLFDTTRFKDAVITVLPKKKEKPKIELPLLSKERNFLTAIRAMSEFLLSPEDLDDLRKTNRRSPFENEPPITVYWRKDVESKAIKVWGSLEAMEKEKLKRDRNIHNYQEYIFQLKKSLRNYQKTHKSQVPPTQTSTETFREKMVTDSSGKVVWTAVVINGVNFIMKLGAWALTGSHCLFAEALHSFADFTNQCILAYGIHKSKQQADVEHPYGYTTMRYVSSLISGAMIFCVGAGLSVQHGISGLIHPGEVFPLYWAFFILGGSLITEGGTLIMAIDAIRKGAKQEKMTFMNYVLRGSDPSVNVVLLEDMAAVIGVGIAFACMGLTSYTGSHIPDALGSCIIGGLLAGVSGFIVYTNSTALVGRSIPQQDIQIINNEIESDVMIRAIHDVKGIDMGSGYVRFKAEVDVDGRELTKKYLNKQDLDALLEEIRHLETTADVEEFILKHGESIVDSLGAEVDRIEKSLKKSHPEVRHIDLEIL